MIKRDKYQLHIYRRKEFKLPRIWAILNGFLPILPPLISIIAHPISKAFDFQGVLILNLTQTPFQYGNSEITKHKHTHIHTLKYGNQKGCCN